MQSAAMRIEHYDNRMTSSQIDPVLAAVNTAAKANFQSYAIDWVALQQAVHNYLDTIGVPAVSYFSYNAFAGEIYHISKHFSGASAVLAAQAMVIKYTGLGCAVPQMTAIALLFNIALP